MIVLPVKQGSIEWQNARLGIPTASQFGRILTRKTMKASASQNGYLCELVAERMLGVPVHEVSSAFMERGSELEAKAAEEYEMETGRTCEVVGFVMDDTMRYGASPDRLIGEDGGLEIKCLAVQNHVAALLGMKDDEHYAQCQGNMLITGRRWWDLRFFNPALASVTVRVERDPDYIRVLDDALHVFCERVDEATERLGIDWRGAAGLPQGKEARRA